MNSALGNGCGAAMLTGPVDVVVIDQPRTAPHEVLVVDPRDVLPAVTRGAAQAAAHQPQQRVEDAARDPDSLPSRSAASPSALHVGASSSARSQDVATSMLNRHVSGASGSAPPMIPVASSFGARSDGRRSWPCSPAARRAAGTPPGHRLADHARGVARATARISRRLFALYRQLTLRPARLITTSAAIDLARPAAEGFRIPVHECQGAVPERG